MEGEGKAKQDARAENGLGIHGIEWWQAKFGYGTHPKMKISAKVHKSYFSI